MISSQRELNKVVWQLEGDLRTLAVLAFPFQRPITEADVRACSVILRKWLLDGLLNQLCRAAGNVVPTFDALDNREVIDAIEREPSVDYFVTGGVQFNGVPVRGIYHAASPSAGKSLLPITEMQYWELKLSKFLRQRRLYFEAAFFRCEEIIRYVANKLGGAHLDFDRPGVYEKLDQASEFMKFGGPVPDPETQFYLVLEETGAEVLSCVHIEIIAAAASFVQLKFNGKPFVELQIKKTWRSLWNRLLGRLRPRYVFHNY